MARVLADDVSLNYNGTNPYLSFLNSNVYDPTGNNNGRLDPGETANLTAVLRNIGGANFTNLQTMLSCTSPYITITDNAGYFGVLPIDSVKENISDPFTVMVSSACPSGHNATFKLIATDGSFADTFTFTKIVGSYHYLVWNPDPTPSSGQTLNNILTSLGYIGAITTNLLTEPDLGLYRSIFICCGVYPNNYIIADNGPEATAIINYLNGGGRVYMEGGEVWYYDPLVGGHNFCPLFGLVGVSDGTGDMGPVIGVTNTFTGGMNFGYSGENSYMDHINAITGFIIFQDGNDSYNCGVAYNQGTYRTVGTSFELGGLVDASAPSIKAILLDSIMRFWGFYPTSIEEQKHEEKKLLCVSLTLYPNFAKRKDLIKIKYSLPADENGIIKIYNNIGRCVRHIPLVKINAENYIYWNGTDENGDNLAAGVYFVTLLTTNRTETRRVVLID